jgi:hypothetical protein
MSTTEEAGGLGSSAAATADKASKAGKKRGKIGFM